jgi:hypothetical protein
MDKDTKRVVKEALRQGWRVEERSKHIMLWPPDKTLSPVTIASTPSDKRALNNDIARMRQRGFQWPPPKK